MRSSSVKTFVVTISMFAFVSAAAVTAQARPATRTPAQSTATRRAPENPGDRLIRAIQRLYDGFRNVTSFALPSPPLPEDSTAPATGTAGQ